MNPIRTFEEASENFRVLEGRASYKFYCFLLYDDEDPQIGLWVRKNFMNLHRLSGNCLVFVVEKPPRSWRLDERKYWQKRFGEEAFRGVWHGWLETKPYNKAEAYRIAEKIGVDKDQLPCAVFFRDIDSRKTVRCRIDAKSDEDLTVFFRELFTRVDRSRRLDELGRQIKIWKATLFFQSLVPNRQKLRDIFVDVAAETIKRKSES